MMPGRSEWTGAYYDGRTAHREPITLTIEAGGLRLRRPDGTGVLWPFNELRQTQGRLPGERLRIEFGTGTVEAVLIDEPGLAEAIRRASPNASRTLRGHVKTSYVLGWSGAAVAVLVAGYLWGAPILSGWLASTVPVAWEESLGRGLIQRLARSDRVCRDVAPAKDLRTVLDRLLAAAPKSPYKFELLVVRDTSVNAFAAPGGFIVVNTGLLEAANTPEEVAGVLAHEIQHVTHRHSTRAIIREIPIRIAVTAVAGSGGVDVATHAVGSLGALRYRRGDEAEADRDGMRLLAAARVDRMGMVTLMRRLEDTRASAPRVVSYLSSHPRPADRVAELERLARDGSYEAQPLLDAAAWQRVRSMCDGNIEDVKIGS